MANESIEGKAYLLKDVLATELDSYYQIPVTNALTNGQKKTAKSF
ncbi:hypothetical protein VN0427_04780 [Helicobacter pylori]